MPYILAGNPQQSIGANQCPRGAAGNSIKAVNTIQVVKLFPSGSSNPSQDISIHSHSHFFSLHSRRSESVLVFMERHGMLEYYVYYRDIVKDTVTATGQLKMSRSCDVTPPRATSIV